MLRLIFATIGNQIQTEASINLEQHYSHRRAINSQNILDILDSVATNRRSVSMNTITAILSTFSN